MTATVATIRAKTKAVIEALTPSGTAHGRSSYVEASEYEEWAERAASDIDREFTLGEIPPGNVMAFGLSGCAPIDTTMDVMIGHWKISDLDEAQERMDTDCFQIVRALEDKANYASGVVLIRNEGATRTDDDEKWITTLRFRIIYEGVI